MLSPFLWMKRVIIQTLLYTVSCERRRDLQCRLTAQSTLRNTDFGQQCGLPTIGTKVELYPISPKRQNDSSKVMLSMDDILRLPLP